MLSELVIAFKGDLTDLSSSFTTAASQVNSFVAQVEDAGKKMQSTLASSMKSTSSGAKETTMSLDELGQVFTSTGSNVDEFNDRMANARVQVEDKFTPSLYGITRAVANFLPSLPEMGSGLMKATSAVGNFATSTVQAGVNLARDFVGGIHNSINSLMEWGRSMGENVFFISELKDHLIGFAEKLFDTNASMEQSQVAFTGLLGSASAANKFLAQLQQFAATTPFEFPELVQDAQMMKAFGFSAQEVIPDLTAIGDAMGAMGAGSQQVQQVVYAFGQMHAAGKLHAQDMMQLTSVGVNGWEMIAKAMHKTIPEVQDLSSKGLIPADDAIKIMLSGMESAFGGSMQRQSQTFNGLISTLKDNISQAWLAFSGPLFDKAKQAVNAITQITSSPAFTNFAKMLGGVVGGALSSVIDLLVSGLGPAFVAIGSGIQNVLPLFSELFGKMDWTGITYGVNILKDAFHLLAQAFEPVGAGSVNLAQQNRTLFAVLAQGFNLIYGIGFQSFQLFAHGIHLVAEVLSQLAPTFQQVGSILLSGLIPVIHQFQAAVSGNAVQGFELWVSVGEQVSVWIRSSLVPALQMALPAFARLYVAVISNVVPVLLKLWEIGTQVASIVFPLIAGAIMTVVPVAIRLAGILADGLALAFRVLGPLVLGVVSGVSKVIEFFQKNQLAADVLAGALIALSVPIMFLATVALVTFVAEAAVTVATAIPGLIAGFVAGAGAAWSMAAGVIGATWPILLIVAVAALVIGGIILAIQHWGEIAHWLQGIWAGVAGFFQGVWQKIQGVFGSIGKWFQDRFQEAKNGAQSAFGNLGQWFQDRFKQASDGAKAGWGNMGKWFQDRGREIVSAGQATWQAFVAAGTWLYKHNYVFQSWVDGLMVSINWVRTFVPAAWQTVANFVVEKWNWLTAQASAVWGAISSTVMGWVTTARDWIVAAWQYVSDQASALWGTVSSTIMNWVGIASQFVQDRWRELEGIASSSWNYISGIIMGVVGPLGAWLQSLWSGTVSAVGAQWNRFVGFAQSVWANVTASFSSAWGAISGVLSVLWSNISGWFANLASQAFTWGSSVVQQIASGIQAGIGAVISAATNVASSIAQLLGWHSPTEKGPGSTSHLWAGNFISMMVKGLKQGIPQVQGAAMALAAQLGILSGGIVPGSLTGTSLSGSVYRASYNGAGTTTGKTHATIVLQLNGREVAKEIGQPLTDHIKMKLGLKN